MKQNNIKKFYISREPGSFNNISGDTKYAITTLFDEKGYPFFKIEYNPLSIHKVTSSIINVYDEKYDAIKEHIINNSSMWLSNPTMNHLYDFQKEIGYLIQSIDREDKLNQLFEEEEGYKPKYKHTTRWI